MVVHAFHEPLRSTHPRWAVGLILALGLLLAAGLVAARPAAALGQSFDRGDVLASVNDGINFYAPDGTLKRTFAAGLAPGALCFDPNGRHLVVLC